MIWQASGNEQHVMIIWQGEEKKTNNIIETAYQTYGPTVRAH